MSNTTHPGTFLQPISGELARVLAQAACSSYAPPTFYVVARYTPAPVGTTAHPFDVQPPVATYAEAEQQVLALGAPGNDYGIFGPYQNGSPAARAENQATVGQMEVTPQGGTETMAPFTIPGQAYDALFYTIQAVKKFVVPYYVQEYGPLFGTLVIDEFNRSPLALMGHLPWSEEDMVGVSPSTAKARTAGKTRYVPVFFGPDGTPRPLLPRAPGRA